MLLEAQPIMSPKFGHAHPKPTKSKQSVHPESYYLPRPTRYVPNSPYPVLIYRSVLPLPCESSTLRETFEPNDWMWGGVFAHFPNYHFHSVTHECFAVVKGSGTVLLGKGPLDKGERGIEVDLRPGDVVVLPAGVAHYILDSDTDYSYYVVFGGLSYVYVTNIAKGSPHWDNNTCQAGKEETAMKADTARNVPIPSSDPLFGKEGPLVQIWEHAGKAGIAYPAYSEQ
ncbi:cupin domain protein [Rutstroemia sp. NJR-2017a BVV2]|nr:cupin domain protein [Rutstroemia sp. NJR-2017a BVV2]